MSNPNPNHNLNNDAAAFLGTDEKQPIYIYRVYFDLLVQIEEEENPITLSDSLDVDAGRDIREAQTKVEEFVMSSGKYHIPASEMFITGAKRLAATEI
jgi:hypothetical protein